LAFRYAINKLFNLYIIINLASLKGSFKNIVLSDIFSLLKVVGFLLCIL